MFDIEFGEITGHCASLRHLILKSIVYCQVRKAKQSMFLIIFSLRLNCISFLDCILQFLPNQLLLDFMTNVIFPYAYPNCIFINNMYACNSRMSHNNVIYSFIVLSFDLFIFE